MSKTYKPASFLDNYDTIIFDLDGVITNEQRYFDAAALTLYQMFTEPFDLQYAINNVDIIKTIILYNGKLVSLLKNLGVNSNWDLTYVIYAFSDILNTFDTVTVYNEIKRLNLPALELYEYIENNSSIGGRDGDGYNYLLLIFQEWYLGDELFKETYNIPMSIEGKPGLAFKEVPLVDLDKTKLVLETLGKYKKLGIASGRIYPEAYTPLNKWGIFHFFNKEHIATYTDIQNAEEETNIFPLTKPHHFLFTKGAIGNKTSYIDIINQNFDKNLLSGVLAIGDAGADMFSAQTAGLDFLAVLTGVAGERARTYFEENNATFIVNNILDLIEEQ